MRPRTAMLRALVLLAIPLGLAACGDEAAPDDPAAGGYTLERANGEPLPTIALTREDEHGTWEVRIVSGELELAAGSYTADFVVDVLLDGQPSLEDWAFQDTGRYTVSGGTVTLTSSHPDSEGPVVGTLAGDALTVSQEVEGYGTFSALYRR